VVGVHEEKGVVGEPGAGGGEERLEVAGVGPARVDDDVVGRELARETAVVSARYPTTTATRLAPAWRAKARS